MSTADALAIARVGERIEANAYVSMIDLAPSSLREEQRAKTKRLGTSTFFTLPRVDWMTPNRVMGLGVYEPASERVLDEVLDLCQTYKPGRFYVPICACAAPSLSTIKGWLMKRNFKPYNDWVKMYRESSVPGEVDDDETSRGKDKGDALSRGPSRPLKIRKVGKEHAREFAETVVEGFGYPREYLPWLELPVGVTGWHHFMAFDGDKPVATGALYVEGDAGNLLLGSTLPAYRGRGAQGDLMRERLRFGTESGCKLFITETNIETPEKPNPSYHNMLRMGFKLAYLRPNYVVIL